MQMETDSGESINELYTFNVISSVCVSRITTRELLQPQKHIKIKKQNRKS